MKNLILYLVVFVITYLFYFIFVLNRKNVLKKFQDGKELTYLKIKYGVKINDSNLKKIANKVCLANSFILSTTVCCVCLFKNIWVEIIVCIVLILVLILSLYHLIGTYYKRKQVSKNV